MITNVLISAYCLCSTCCEQAVYRNNSRVGAAYTPVQVGRTIAAPTSFPFGTRVSFKLGTRVYNRIVEDRLSSSMSNRWDILVSSHREAKKWGVKKVKLTYDTPKTAP